MGVTVIGPVPAVLPLEYVAPAVQIKAEWNYGWEYAPELEVITASWSAVGQDLSAATFKYRYGPLIKHPHEALYSQRSAVQLDGYWVRILMVGDQGQLVEQFVGRVSGESRKVMGNSGGRRGIQTYPAFGPMQILRKIEISKSYWLQNGNKIDVGWTPHMNRRDKPGFLIGNRSPTQIDGSYVFGGTDLWSRYEYLEYILKQFVQQENGPTWTLSGQVDLLKGYTDEVGISLGGKASEIIRRLIPRNYGLDYTIDPTENGFAIRVYALSAEEINFQGAVLPANPGTVEIVTGETIDMQSVQIVKASEHKYDKVRLIGDRVVVVCTDALEAKWTPALEAAYKAGTGTPSDSAKDHDDVRGDDRFRNCYQFYGMPVNWDFIGGYATPIIGSDGQIAGFGAPNQKQVRKTLTWLPLREGWDYTVEPPVDMNLPGVEAGFKPPLAIVQREDGSNKYVNVDAAGIGVSVPKNEWGIFINAYPNHYMAHGHFFKELDKSEKEPRYNYETVEVAIAFETDQRLQLEYELPEPDRSGDGSVKEILVRGAELWVMAPNTLLGVNAVGLPIYSRNSYYELRNDTTRLSYLMAGAISRYLVRRARAAIPVHGALPWSQLIGKILTVIEDGGDTQDIQAPITSIEWNFENQPTTIIRAGFAQT